MNSHIQILLLPRNYESTDEYYLYDNTVYTINKVLNQAGVNSKYLDDKPIQFLEQRAWSAEKRVETELIDNLYVQMYVQVITLSDGLNLVASLTKQNNHNCFYQYFNI
jgi:hypothetical protein